MTAFAAFLSINPNFHVIGKSQKDNSSRNPKQDFFMRMETVFDVISDFNHNYLFINLISHS